MANVRILGARKTILNLRKFVEKEMVSEQMLKEIGDRGAKLMRNFARTGKTAQFDGGKRQAMPALKAATVEKRKKLAKINNTHALFRPKRSNVTFTGQFLESIKTQKTNLKKRQVFVGPSGTRKPIKTGPNSTEKNPPTNEELAEFLAGGNPNIKPRKILFLPQASKKQLVQIANKFIGKEILKRGFTG